jgi:outer membrane protease
MFRRIFDTPSRILLALFALSLTALAQNPTPVTTPTQPLAEKNGYSFGVRGDFSMVYGESREIVYQNFFGYSEKMSELFWDINSIPMVGLVLSLETPHRLTANAGYWTAVDEGQGALDNYDWLIYSGDDNWSDWSHSPVEVDEAFRWDVNLAYAVIQKPSFNLNTLLGYRHMFWKWADHGGNFIYSSENGFRDLTGSFETYFGDSTGIEYEQTFDIPYLGLSTGWRGRKVAVDAYVLFSPLVSAEDEDYHVYRDTRFTESFEDGDFWAAGLNARYHFNDQLYLLVGVEYQEVSEIRGSMEIDGDPVPASLADAGIAHKATTGTLALGYEFGR